MIGECILFEAPCISYHKLLLLIPFYVFVIGAALGDCMTDQFSISSIGTKGSPVICGTNGGYHSKFILLLMQFVHRKKFQFSLMLHLLVIVEAADACHRATFNIGGLTTTTRKWDIRVTQYACGDFDSSGNL